MQNLTTANEKVMTTNKKSHDYKAQLIKNTKQTKKS